MAKKKAKKKSSKKREYRPLYKAKPKRKKKMPQHVKDYLACIHAGKGKRFCRKKHLDGK